ncbi:MAG: ABC transporter ATP-binding protein [OCS116 cluster bacterium]|nr:ABC transporter ATP-binding protein [OCS116 cluster bacterium]
MDNSLLRINNLSSGYGDFQALFDVSFCLEKNSVLGLVGANGAGKTTLFKSILGLLPREKSMIQFQRQDIGHLSANKLAGLGIAMVPEGRRLFSSLSVYENLQIAADYGRKGYWTIERVFELFPILAEKQKMPSLSLSGGQQQMVAIGRALVANPEVILFDELSLGLAPTVVNDVYAAMPSIIESGISAILVEQDIERVRKISKNLVCMREGKIVLSGAASQFTKEQLTTAYFGE